MKWQLVKADGKELDASVFDPEMHVLGCRQLCVTCSCHRNLPRDVSAMSRGEAPNVNRGVGQVRQVRVEPVTVRVVLAGAGLRARDNRAAFAHERFQSERMKQTRNLSASESEVDQARDVVHQD